MPESISRKRLYDLVWAEPMTKVAKGYGVSSNYLARICEQLNIPRPPRGYWAQHKVGKAPKQPPLPETQPGDEVEWTRGGVFGRRNKRKLPETPTKTPRRKRRRKADRPKTHPLIAEAREHFKKGRVDDDEYFRPNKKLIADIFASKDGHGRALEIADELYLTLEDADYRVMIATKNSGYTRASIDPQAGRRNPYDTNTWRPWRPTVVFVGDLAYGIAIFEISEKAEVKYHKGRWVRLADLPKSRRRNLGWTSTHELPSGRFAIHVYCPHYGVDWEKVWKEKKQGELNTKHRTIRRVMETAGTDIVKLMQKAEREAERKQAEWESQRKKRELEREEKRKKEAYQSSREQLLGIIEQWTLACRIEEFLNNLERSAGMLQETEKTSVLERLECAREMFGGVETLKHFELWKTPDQRLTQEYRWPWSLV